MRKLHSVKTKPVNSSDYTLFSSARYYNSDLSIWLSVDPLSDKYPNLSPYTYCADNPVGLVDEDGKEFVDREGNRVKIRVHKDGTILYKFSHHASEEVQNDFISKHSASLSALAKTKAGRKCIRFLNTCYTSVSIDPTDEGGERNSLVKPYRDKNDNVLMTDGVYEGVTITPYMETINNKANNDGVDVDEILGATLIVEAGHLKKNQIIKDGNGNLSQESKYYRLYNQYVDYRFHYRLEMGQQINNTVFNNSSNVKPRLNRINTKRQNKYGQN